MTADEIRTLKNKLNPDHESGCFWFGEIALQLALGNERLERIATALETAQCRSCRGSGWIERNPREFDACSHCNADGARRMEDPHA